MDGGVRKTIYKKEFDEDLETKILGITFEEEKEKVKDKNIFDLLFIALELSKYELFLHDIEDIDYLVKIKTKEISLLDKSKIDYLYMLGYKTMKEYLKNTNLKY